MISEDRSQIRMSEVRARLEELQRASERSRGI